MMPAHSDNEVWRNSPTLPDYMVSSHGRFMRIPFDGEMPNGSRRHYGGEPHFGVLVDGRYQFSFKGKNYRVHRLVCEAFGGPSPFPNAVVMHIDEDSTNNRADNLAWGTQKENLAAPGFRAYLKRRGAVKSSLTTDDVKIIKYGASSGASLARRFNVSPATISNIRNGRSWRHV